MEHCFGVRMRFLNGGSLSKNGRSLSSLALERINSNNMDIFDANTISLFFVAWAILIGLTAYIANRRGANELLWGLLALVIGPLALIAVFVAGTGRECSFCRSSVHRQATKCPKCQSDISTTA
jgi:hypothetical protein